MKVHHEEQYGQGRFFAKVPHGEAETVYLSGQHVRTFIHTGVPEEDEHHGFATELVAEAIKQSRAAGFTVRAMCPFVAAYLEKHPELTQRPRKNHKL